MSGFMNLLPDFCPFSDFVSYLNDATSGFGGFLSNLNWFIPIADMIVILELWGLAIGVWYAATTVLRSINAIQ